MYAAACSRASGRNPSSFAKQIASGSRSFPTRPVRCIRNNAPSSSLKHCNIKQSSFEIFKNVLLSVAFALVVTSM